MSKSIGILTGGGDAPGLNAVIRAVVKYASGVKGWKCYGIEESFNGLMFEDKEIWPMAPKDCQGLLTRGGTVLGTTNRGNPFAEVAPGRTRADLAADKFKALGLEGLVVIGGVGRRRLGIV